MNSTLSPTDWRTGHGSAQDGRPRLPPERGTYALVLRCDMPDRLDVGALGRIEIHPGYYIYVGSAMGPGGLRARVSRHLRRAGKCHWHIDYLRRKLPVLEIWYAEADATLEHDWAATIEACDLASIPVPRFGSSDCRCESHLFHCSGTTSLDHLQERLRSSLRQCADVKCLLLDHLAC